MKKLSYTTIILAAACLLLPGCSDDAADQVFVSPDVLVADSEVEIRLSSNSSDMVTRAGVIGVKDTFSTSNYMGIFCLAEEALPDTEATEATEETEKKGCGSVIGGGAIIVLMTAALAGCAIIKKKEN